MKARSLNLELLRIVAMLGIVMMHALLASGVLTGDDLYSCNYYIAWTVEALCVGAVNVYVLISGYFAPKSRFRLSKLMMVWLQVAFYTISLFLLSCILGKQSFSLGTVINRLLPVTSGQYWFVTVWIVLYIISPALNWFVKNADKRLYRLTLLTFFVVFSVWSFVTFKDPIGLDSGYSLYWLIFIYLVGGYIGVYRDDFKKSKLFYFAAFLICSLLTAAGRFLIAHLTMNLIGSVRGTRIFYSYSAPLVLFGAIALFIFFLNFNIKEKYKKIVMFFSSATFGVYLIHMNLDVYRIIFKDIFKVHALQNNPVLILYCIGVMGLVFVSCAVLEKIRSYLFDKIHICKLCKFMENLVITKFLKYFMGS